MRQLDEEKEEVQVQLSFEGVAVTTSRLTISAFHLIPREPMRQFDEIEFRGKATILEISHKGDPKAKTARRISVAVVGGAEITDHRRRGE